MPIAIETIQRFQEVVNRVYGRDLTFAQASEILNSLTGYFGLLKKIKMREIADEYEKQSDDNRGA